MSKRYPAFFGKWFLLVLLMAVQGSQAQGQSLPMVMDMIHHNPGEPLLISAYDNPAFLAKQGYTAQVLNDYSFAHAGLLFDAVDKRIFPAGSAERAWVQGVQQKVKRKIAEAHKAGIKIYFFTDIIVLPKRLVELYGDRLKDENGKISFEQPFTDTVHRLMLRELFATFPDMDGLVIRTGETYLNNVPYHTGNNPITNRAESHAKLLNILRDEVCERQNKTLIYRTWSFGGLHDNADYYLEVANRIAPHPNLIFSIKHTQGDYHRTFNFNPTLGLGQHPQVVEVQCQREYEGKGAFPNYVMNGVLDGFEEYGSIRPQPGYKSLNSLKASPLLRGVYGWSRGGGWVGPYIQNEFWCRLNAFVLAGWARNTGRSEAQLFNDFMVAEGVETRSRPAFRQLCLLSAKAVLRGHATATLPWEQNWVWWTRDEFLSGTDTVTQSGEKLQSLRPIFEAYSAKGLLHAALVEKDEAARLWAQMVALSQTIRLRNKKDEAYVRSSTRYGWHLHRIIAAGWRALALGYQAEQSGQVNKAALAKAIRQYDKAWADYRAFGKSGAQAASLYKSYAFVFKGPRYHQEGGMGASVDRYRKLIAP